MAKGKHAAIASNARIVKLEEKLDALEAEYSDYRSSKEMEVQELKRNTAAVQSLLDNEVRRLSDERVREIEWHYHSLQKDQSESRDKKAINIARILDRNKVELKEEDWTEMAKELDVRVGVLLDSGYANRRARRARNSTMKKVAADRDMPEHVDKVWVGGE